MVLPQLLKINILVLLRFNWSGLMSESQQGTEICDVISRKRYCYEVSVNPEFGLTLTRRLNQSCFPAVL